MPKRETVVPTDEQQAIIEATAGGGSVLVEALAGCAKSTTLELAARRIKAPTLAVAFSRKIVDDMEGRFADNVTIKSFNGLGHGVWQRRTDTKLVLDERKIGKLCTENAKAAKMDLSSEQWDGLRQLVSGAMRYGVVPKAHGEGLLPDDPTTWHDIGADLALDAADVDLLWELARTTLGDSIVLAKRGTICYDDQIYCPTLLGGQWPRYSHVLVDESQDLSPLNQLMLQRALHPAGRLVAAGDTRQSIFAFRGADSDAMKNLRGLRQEWVDLDLSLTFRCPKVVVARQQGHAPKFRAAPGNHQGEELAWRRSFAEREAGESRPWGFAKVAEAGLPGARIAVLCRNNAPLLSLAFKLLASGVGVVMLGREIGKGLQSLAKKLSPQGDAPMDVFLAKLAEWELSETSAARLAGHEGKVAAIEDRANCLRAVAPNARDVAELCLALERLFARESGRLTLASVHKAKGLEWDTVLHLDPWRLPSKQAKKALARGDGRGMEQEMNLLYVAETRTRHTIIEADLEDFAP